MVGSKDGLQAARAKWRFRGTTRPEFALTPGPGQESVWDYPRPPRIVPDRRRVQVLREGHVVADSRDALRVLETASPPTFYLPPADVDREALVASATRSMCEWKGLARYWSLKAGGGLLEDVAWSYPSPFEGYSAIAGHLAFYPAKLECLVAGERVAPQPGGLYGGWVTSEIVGPFKGEEGTAWW